LKIENVKFKISNEIAEKMELLKPSSIFYFVGGILILKEFLRIYR
jgi:hypothetical protein